MAGHGGLDTAADLQPPHHRAEKRAGLRECAQILGVTTLVKIGWPGAICLEGPKDRVDAFVNHITRWRWKQLAVRGEQDAETRALPRIFLETSDMSTFAGHLRLPVSGRFWTAFKVATPPSTYSNSKSSSASAPISRNARSSASKIASASGTLLQSALSVP